MDAHSLSLFQCLSAFRIIPPSPCLAHRLAFLLSIFSPLLFCVKIFLVFFAILHYFLPEKVLFGWNFKLLKALKSFFDKFFGNLNFCGTLSYSICKRWCYLVGQLVELGCEGNLYLGDGCCWLATFCGGVNPCMLFRFYPGRLQF